MIWLIWRLHRTESLIGLALLGALGVALTVTGLDVADTYRTMGLGTCLADAGDDGDALRSCNQLTNAFFREFDMLRGLVEWLNFLPVIVAMLLAAPFLNELEHGSFRLSWTQSVTRVRWAAVRIGTILGVAALTGVVWRTVMTWWSEPFGELRGRMEPNAFNFQGIVPIAYFVFAAALILAAGSISRRTVATLVVALVVFLPVRLGIENRLRPHYREPLTAVESADRQPSFPNVAAGEHDWVVANGFVDELGNRVSGDEFAALCPPIIREDVERIVRTEDGDCFVTNGLRVYEEYQPAGRFWEFQLIEAALYLGLAAGLVALTFWWVTRRLA